MKRPWDKFAVANTESPSSWSGNDCVPLDTVSHVAHVPSAIRIREDGCLRGDLVFDKSKLNDQRIRVVWLSPNDWVNGFRYGNVRFTFEWQSLIAGHRYYWVESIAYGITACRILITDEARDSLEPYDPSAGDGPWWLALDGKHYRNGNYTLEFMFEGDLALAAASVDFVRHHTSMCSIDPAACLYRGWPADRAGAEFLAAVASKGSLKELRGLVETQDGKLVSSLSLYGAAVTLSRRSEKLVPHSWGAIAGSVRSGNSGRFVEGVIIAL